MVTVGVVVKLAGLGDNADGSLLGLDVDALDVIRGLAVLLHAAVEGDGALNGGLRVELGGNELEEDVLHDVRAVRALELELLALEENVVETPGLGGQDRVVTLLTLLDEESEVDGTRTSVTGSPRLTRASVGSVTVSTERLAVNESLGDNVDSLVAGVAEQLGDNGSRGDLDEDNVVKTNTVEGVLESEASLDLVSLDSGSEDILNSEGFWPLAMLVRLIQSATERMEPMLSEG